MEWTFPNNFPIEDIGRWRDDSDSCQSAQGSSISTNYDQSQQTSSFSDMNSSFSSSNDENSLQRNSSIGSDYYSGSCGTSSLRINGVMGSKKIPSMKIGCFIVESTIGEGNFSSVKLATHTITRLKVAIKIIDKTRLNAENLKKVYREVEIMKQLHHTNIVKLYQVMRTDKCVFIVMEYAPSGELFDYIRMNGKFSEADAKPKFAQIVHAVEHCHEMGIAHRDLKAENLLLDASNNIKLADFGFGAFSGTSNHLSTCCGSPPYAAPEIFKGEKYIGTKADIWSLGVVLYVLVCGALPFDEQYLPKLKNQVLAGHFRIPYWLSHECGDLIRIMLTRCPDRRPTITRVKQHRWLQDYADVPPRNSGPCLAEEMKIGRFNELVIQQMERSGMQRPKILESLEHCAYDHLTALYLLLGERLKQHRQSCPSSNATSYELMMRRPSSLADAALVHFPVAGRPPIHLQAPRATVASQQPTQTDLLQMYMQNMNLRDGTEENGAQLVPPSIDEITDEGTPEHRSARRHTISEGTGDAPCCTFGTSRLSQTPSEAFSGEGGSEAGIAIKALNNNSFAACKLTGFVSPNDCVLGPTRMAFSMSPAEPNPLHAFHKGTSLQGSTSLRPTYLIGLFTGSPTNEQSVESETAPGNSLCPDMLREGRRASDGGLTRLPLDQIRALKESDRSGGMVSLCQGQGNLHPQHVTAAQRHAAQCRGSTAQPYPTGVFFQSAQVPAHPNSPLTNHCPSAHIASQSQPAQGPRVLRRRSNSRRHGAYRPMALPCIPSHEPMEDALLQPSSTSHWPCQ